jgi:hypothetical protein
MKTLPFVAALLVAAPAVADDTKTPAVPANPPVTTPANFEIPVKDQQLDALDKLMEKRLAAKKLPQSESDIGMRDVPKKKDEGNADAAANGAAAQH